MTVLCVCPSGQNTRETLAKGTYLKDYKIIWKKKVRKMKKKKKILGDFNCAMDKMGRGGGNKTKTLYRSGSNYTLSKLIVDNGLEDIYRRENPNSSAFSHYHRSSGTRSRTHRIYTDIKIARNTKINHIIVSFTDHYNAISLGRLPSKTKIGKVNGTLIILFYVSPSSPLLQRIYVFY